MSRASLLSRYIWRAASEPQAAWLPMAVMTVLILSSMAVLSSTAYAQPPANDTCAEAQPLMLGDFIEMSTVEASLGPAPQCSLSGDSPDVWFRLEGDADQLVFLSTLGSTLDTEIAVYRRGCPEDGASATCFRSDEVAAARLQDGPGPWVRVSGAGGASGDFVLAMVRGATVGGRVLGDDGAPLEGVVVSLIDAYLTQMGVDTTDAEGAWQIEDLQAGAYYALARPPQGSDFLLELYDGVLCPFGIAYGGEPGCDLFDGARIEVELGEVVESIDFDLERGGAILGTVRREDSGEPLSEVSVNVVASSGGYLRRRSLTQPDGTYRVTALPSGEHFVFTTSDGDYADELWDGIPCEPSCDPVDGTPVRVEQGFETSDIDFALVSRATLAGRVVDSSTGEPIGSSLLELFDIEGELITTTRPDPADGAFSLGGLSPGTYFLRTRNTPGYIDELFDGVFCPGEPFEGADACDPTTGTPIEIEPGSTVLVDLTLDLGGSISGRVTDEKTGNPIPGSTGVYLFSETGDFLFEAHTDADGIFRFSSLLAGPYFAMTRLGPSSVWVDEIWEEIPCPQGLSGPDPCRPELGTRIPIELGEETSEIDFALGRRGGISGRVTNAAGEPLRNLAVRVLGGSGGLDLTDEDGHYQIGGLAPGEYTVLTDGSEPYIDEIWDDHPCPERLCDVSVGDRISLQLGDEVTGIDFVLTEGGVISGQVREVTGEPVIYDVDIEVFDAEGNLFQRSSGLSAEGRYSIRGLIPGTYFVRTESLYFIDEIWDDIPCSEDGCPPGTPIVVEGGETSTEIDFVLRRRPFSSPELPLLDSRFRVTARWETRDGDSGVAQGVVLTQDSGYFWFFSEPNVEIVVKVLDACFEPFNHFWFFAAGLTNVGVEITVEDLESGQVKVYRNPLGTPFAPIQDTRAFATCDLGAGAGNGASAAAPDVERAGATTISATASAATLRQLEETLAVLSPERPADVPTGVAPSCVPDGESLCLSDGRFQVRARWRTDEREGAGRAVSLTSDTGFFWFFGPDNIEIVVKVLDACELRFNSFWVFAGGLTNVEVELEVTDTVTGEVREWESALGTAFAPIQDTRAFETCPEEP